MKALSLHTLDILPDGLLELPARELHRLLPGPTLIHLRGRRRQGLFVSVLLHGNEVGGWEAVRSLLASGWTAGLPRDLYLFIANVEAARLGLRHLPGQRDYNRVWPGCADPHSPEARLMQDVVERLAGVELFASVDLHNTTGINPHYGCTNYLQPEYLHLATLFSRTVVYFRSPAGVCSMAMGRHVPAVTLECGRVGEAHGVEHAREFLSACLHMARLPDHPVAAHDIELYHTVATVRLRENVDCGFDHDGQPPKLLLSQGLERLNFREAAPGTPLGMVRPDCPHPVVVTDDSGADVTESYLGVHDGRLQLRRPVMPSMLTSDPEVIRQDCLCYLMERRALPD